MVFQDFLKGGSPFRQSLRCVKENALRPPTEQICVGSCSRIDKHKFKRKSFVPPAL